MTSRSTLTRGSGGLPEVAVRSAAYPNRLAGYATFGAVVSAMPLPWLPDSLLRRVRGALVHDVAARHGVSLSREARDVLSGPSGDKGARAFAWSTVRYLGVRVAVRMLGRFGPVAVVWPLRDALRIYALGHLFDRYLETLRAERAVRIDTEEARRVRRAIDGAVVRAVTIEASKPKEPAVIDDQRDAVTALLDGAIGLVASLPGRVMRRLDAAFDDLLTQADG